MLLSDMRFAPIAPDAPRLPALPPPATAADPAQVDIMVAYTPAARLEAGSATAIQAMINKSIADTNQAYVNSQIYMQLRLVQTVEVAYTENFDMSVDLDALTATNDGVMDSLHQLRNTWGADLVTLFTADTGGMAAGIAWVMTDPNYTGNDTLGFSVVMQKYADSTNYTLAHELGHNLGAVHDRPNSTFPGAFPYSYGHRFNGNDGVEYRTIMSYAPGQRIPNFSNPNITYQGVATGVPIGQPGEADNASTFNQTGPIVEAYRQDVVSDKANPLASLSSWNLSPNGQVLSFTIRYSDDIAIDSGTLGTGDVVVSGPGGFQQTAAFVSVDRTGNAPVLLVTYQVSAAAPLAQGLYTLAVQANQVTDTIAKPVAATSFTIDTAPPAAVLTSAADITSEFGNTYVFAVTYTDNLAIDASTIDSADILVTGPGGYSQVARLLNVTPGFNGSPQIAYYAITSRYIAWDGLENGTYSISVVSGQVADTSGNTALPGVIGTFRVSIAGSTIPGSLNLGTLSTTQIVNETLSPLDPADVYRVYLAARSDLSVYLIGLTDDADLSLVQDANGDGIVDPGETLASSSNPGTMDESVTATVDPGFYYIVVTRIGSNVNYALSLTRLSDTPAAALVPGSVVESDAGVSFSVSYSDGESIAWATLDSTDILVTGPGNFMTQATLLSVDMPADGTPRTATYTIAPPGGGWDINDSGTYLFWVQANQVSDIAGRFVAPTLLETRPITILDQTAPGVRLISAPSVSAAGGSEQAITIEVSDLGNVNAASLDGEVIGVTGPNGFDQLAVFDSADGKGNAPLRSATYILTPPGGTWDLTDNGLYTVTLLSGVVADASGNRVGQTTLGVFEVAIPDTTAPEAALEVSDIAQPSSTAQTLRITFTDDTALNAATFDARDIVVMGPKNFAQLASFAGVDQTGNGQVRAVTYLLPAPGGTWDRADNGTYNVLLQSGQVADTSGNRMRSRTVGSFKVEVPDTTPPTAVLNAPNLTTAGSSSHNLIVVWSDDTAIDVIRLDSSDLLITGPGGFNQLAAFEAVDLTINGTPRITTYRVAAPAGGWTASHNGTYVVSIRENQVADDSGNYAAAKVLGSFAVHVPDVVAPTAQLLSQRVTKAGARFYNFKVTYSDNLALKASSISRAVLQVSGPAGFRQNAKRISAITGRPGALTATYRIKVPGNKWDVLDNGDYTVSVISGTVTDTAGNPLATRALGSFSCRIPAKRLFSTVKIRRE